MKLMQCYPPPKIKVKALRAEAGTPPRVQGAALHNELQEGHTELLNVILSQEKKKKG